LAFVQEAIRNRDWHDLLAVLEAFQSSSENCDSEPLATIYDFGQLCITTHIADAHASAGSWEDAYSLIGNVYTMLLIGGEYCIRPRQFRIEVQLLCLIVLAKCKWQGEDDDRNRIRSPLQMISDFYQLASHVESCAESTSRSSPSYKETRELLAIANLEIAKMAFRYCAEHVQTLVRFFNEHTADSISLELAHYRSNTPFGTDRYWDFELAKLYISGNLTHSTFAECYAIRKKHMTAQPPEESSLMPWKGFGETMLQRSKQRRRLEVIGGNSA
jgi:hypothetical protein